MNGLDITTTIKLKYENPGLNSSKNSGLFLEEEPQYETLLQPYPFIKDVETDIMPQFDVPIDDKDQSITDTLSEPIKCNWIKLLKSNFSENTLNRIYLLANFNKNQKDYDIAKLSTTSLHYFLEFWLCVKDHAIEPFLTITPNGNIQVEWHKNSKRMLDVEFDVNGYAYVTLTDGKSLVDKYDNVEQVSRDLLSRKSKPLKWRE